MTAKYFAILTNYGAAQLANAVALGTQMNISAMAVGDGGGTLPVPDPAQTKLVRETRRAAVNQVSIDEKNPNFIIAEQVIPENEGGWFIREIGLFDDNGGLIAVGNAPETYKPNLQEGSGRTQVIQMVLMVSSTQAITLKVDPSVVLATREYVTKSIDAAIQVSETKAARIYATKSELSTGLSGKQPTGDYATKTEVNSKLAKDQNGADIPNKDTFIKNLGLGDINTAGVATGSLGSAGYAIFPIMINGVRKTLIMQWGKLVPLTSGSTVGVNLPIAFPTAIMQAYATHDNEEHAARPTVYAIGATSRSTITATATQLTAGSAGATVTRGSDGAACYGRYFAIGY